MPAVERRQQILDAAEVVFAVDGYEDVGTATVAAEAGVSEPTLYRYFDSKRELYVAMLERNSERLLASWRKTAAESPDPMSALVEIGTAYAEQLDENPAPFLLRARALLETGDEPVAEQARKQFWSTFEFVKGLYDEALEAGQIAADSDTGSLAWLYMAVGGLLDQFLLMELEAPSQDELSRIMALVWPRTREGKPSNPPARKIRYKNRR